MIREAFQRTWTSGECYTVNILRHIQIGFIEGSLYGDWLIEESANIVTRSTFTFQECIHHIPLMRFNCYHRVYPTKSFMAETSYMSI